MESAFLLYQNGYGVEFLDAPQSVLLGSDGSTYRRYSVAEELAAPVDQGDPAPSVLSPDGSFVVTAGLAGSGVVTVASIGDGQRREFPVSDGGDAVPLSIDSTGSVLLLADDGPLSPLLDQEFRLHGSLALLSLSTGELTPYAEPTDVGGAALSPDGRRIAADTADGIVVLDADGSDVVPIDLGGSPAYLDGDAWSPGGDRFAAATDSGIVVVDLAGREPELATIPLESGVVGSAIGWRDGETLLLHLSDLSGRNESSFAWADVATGRVDEIATYSPDLTGAALGGPDVARDQVATVSVQPRPTERGAFPVVFAAGASVLGGLLAWVLTPRGRSLSRFVIPRPRRKALHQARLEFDTNG